MGPTSPNLEEIFFAASGIEDAAARDAYLDAVCGRDTDLRDRVEQWLASEPLVSRFLESPAVSPASIDSPPTPEAGSAVGPYHLLEPIGEGGMGVVYVAEQRRPVRRQVALKLIKPGMDSKAVIARFEAERQALALMDHPNIAKVFDGGTTESGRPFFVMELVRGIPITEYCDRERLSVAERLELFVLVCRAVQHAHQKGIIHRDLKPTNILVTLHDGTPVPKVIDFGIAKAIGQGLTENTVYTGFLQLVGTPLYMSPEQADISGLDVDTRGDIYSLGVLLYELLTGTTPFHPDSLRGAAIDEMRRIIREQDPPKPSTRLSSMGAALTTVSANRKADARRLDRTVRGELDWIVMKALEKDRRRRYETANDFAADVMRHLTDQPVEACPPSTWYRFAKYARRHRAALTTTAIVGFALVAGTSVSAWQAVRATRAGALAARREGDALSAADETRAVLKFLVQDMLGASNPEQALGRDVKVAEVLANAEKKIDAAFPDQPLVEAGVRHALASSYHALGRYDVAHRHSTRAYTLRQSLLGPDHADTLASSANLADYLRHLERWDESRVLSERTLEIRRRIRGPEHTDTLQSMNNLAVVLQNQGKLDEARALYEKTLEIHRRVLPPEHPSTLNSMANLGFVLYMQGRVDEARTLLEQTLEARCRILPPEHPDTLSSMSDLAIVLKRQGKLDEARKLHEQTLEARRRVLPYEHLDTLKSMSELAGVLYQQNEPDAARKLIEQTLEARRRTLGPEHIDTLGSMSNLASVLHQQGKLDEAHDLLEQALEIQRRTLRPEHPNTLSSMGNLAIVLSSQGKLDNARKLYEQLLEIHRRVWGPEHLQTLGLMNDLAIVLARQGKLDEARALHEQTLDIRRRVRGLEHPETLRSMFNLAVVLGNQDEVDAARKLGEQTLEIQRRVRGPMHPDTLKSIDLLVDQILATPDASIDDLAWALEWARRAAERDPGGPLGWQRLSMAEYRAGRWDAAIEAAQKNFEVRDDAGEVGAWLVLALSRERRGEMEQACEWYVRARSAIDAGKANAPRWLIDEAASILGPQALGNPPPSRPVVTPPGPSM